METNKIWRVVPLPSDCWLITASVDGKRMEAEHIMYAAYSADPDSPRQEWEGLDLKIDYFNCFGANLTDVMHLSLMEGKGVCRQFGMASWPIVRGIYNAASDVFTEDDNSIYRFENDQIAKIKPLVDSYKLKNYNYDLCP